MGPRAALDRLFIDCPAAGRAAKRIVFHMAVGCQTGTASITLNGDFVPVTRSSANPALANWTRLSAEDLEEMPILAEFKRIRTWNA
jgi:hypothetical protein